MNTTMTTDRTEIRNSADDDVRSEQPLRCAANTDRELFREPKGDYPSEYYAPHVFTTLTGLIGMSADGTGHVQSLRAWMHAADLFGALANAEQHASWTTYAEEQHAEILRLREALAQVKEICDDAEDLGLWLTVSRIRAAIEG